MESLWSAAHVRAACSMQPAWYIFRSLHSSLFSGIDTRRLPTHTPPLPPAWIPIQVPVLSNPGEADMTADVNFGLLRRLVDGVEGARPHGPVGQGQFLREMGIGARLTALAEQPHVTEEQVRPEHTTRRRWRKIALSML